MSVLKVAKLGNPILRQIAEPIDLESLSLSNGEVQLLIDNMIDTMREEGGVGLAAPQVFKSLQLVIMECSSNDPVCEQTRRHVSNCISLSTGVESAVHSRGWCRIGPEESAFRQFVWSKGDVNAQVKRACSRS